VNRLARAAWLCLALLSLFTIGAGVTVAHLLPGRLALLRPGRRALRGMPICWTQQRRHPSHNCAASSLPASSTSSLTNALLSK